MQHRMHDAPLLQPARAHILTWHYASLNALPVACSAHRGSYGMTDMLCGCYSVCRCAVWYIRGVPIPGAGAVQDPIHRADDTQQRSGVWAVPRGGLIATLRQESGLLKGGLDGSSGNVQHLGRRACQTLLLYLYNSLPTLCCLAEGCSGSSLIPTEALAFGMAIFVWDCFSVWKVQVNCWSGTGHKNQQRPPLRRDATIRLHVRPLRHCTVPCA